MENLNNTEGIAKLKDLVETIKTCFFCTEEKKHDGAAATIMTAQQVDNEGNIWFFSGLDSERNSAIKTNSKVQVYFSDISKNFYVGATGEATIVMDKNKMEELWNPFLKIWFKYGVEDANISLIKLKTTNAHYWDNEGGKMINFFKMMASVITGNDYVDAKEGKINL